MTYLRHEVAEASCVDIDIIPGKPLVGTLRDRIDQDLLCTRSEASDLIRYNTDNSSFSAITGFFDSGRWRFIDIDAVRTRIVTELHRSSPPDRRSLWLLTARHLGA